MKDTDYSKQLESFVAEVIAKGIDEFQNPETWSLSEEALNGVLIGYELPTKTSRTLLHEIGQKHGLIPLCPDDVIDLKMSDEYKPIGVVVISRHGEFMVRTKNG